jgi:hypothetical protein
MNLNPGQANVIQQLQLWHQDPEVNAINLSAIAGAGKEQPNSELVLTPAGFVPMGCIKKGNYVIGSNGLPTEVLGVHPQGLKEVYEVAFQDNTVVKCGIEHLWTVNYTTHGKIKTKTVLTSELIKLVQSSKIPYSVPRFHGDYSSSKELSVDCAWQLGYALGNGCFSAAQLLISCHTKDLEVVLKAFDAISKKPGVYRSTSTNGSQIAYPWLAMPKEIQELRDQKLDKKVPDCVVEASNDVRLKTFSGYFDADGCNRSTNKNGFNCSNKILFTGLVDLARSVGHRVCVVSPDTRKEVSYSANIVFSSVFYQVIKNPSLPKRNYHYTPSIKSVHSLGYKEESTCITVAAEDSLYVTANYKLTHNTFTLSHYVGLQSEPTNIIAPTHSALAVLRQKLSGSMPEGTKFMTVAKALGQFPVQSNMSAEVRFGSFGGKKLEGLTIVDESSMLSDTEVLSLIRLCEKVIFSGDHNQLAPVKKKSGYEELQKLPQLTLTQMMRAESTAILEAGLECLKKTQFVPESSEDGSVVCHETEAEFKAAFLEQVVNEKPGDCVFITYTNAEVQEMNTAAHFKVTGRNTLAVGDAVRLYQSSKLGKNNAVVTIATIEDSVGGNYIVTSEPTEDGTFHKVEVALPFQYENVERQMNAIIAQFNAGNGNEFLADELEVLRSIVPIDFPYSVTTHKSQGSSIKIVFANSQKLHGKKSFYVGYSRASQQLNVVRRVSKTKGVRLTGDTWKNKKTGVVLNVADINNLKEVLAAITEITPDAKDIPSLSALYCTCNPSHASRSAKGWSLV